MAKIERQLLEMHKDFRQIMDGINETNAQQQINKFSKLLTEIEKVSKYNKSWILHDCSLSGVPDAQQGADHLSADPTAVLRRPW